MTTQTTKHASDFGHIAVEAGVRASTAASQLAELAKANVDALLQSGKLLNGGMKAIRENALEDSRQGFASFSNDLRELAAVRSPSELMRLQEELTRRNAGIAVATIARSGRAFGELATSIIAPLSTQAKANIEAIRTFV